MATKLIPSQMAAHVGRSLELPNAHPKHLDWKLAYIAGTFGVTAGEATP